MDWVKILEDLVRIDTSNPPGKNYEKVIDYLEPLFLEVNYETQKIFIPKECAHGLEDRVNLLAHRRNPGKPRLLFYAHIDVVPAEGWDAFNPRVEEGKLYGRGAADMKGAIPALLLALEKTREKLVNYDISVMITTDEETGQAEQIKYLDQFLQPTKGAYFFNPDTNFGYVCVAGLGAIHFEIKVKGKSVHSADSHLGINAVENAVPLMEALLKLKKKVVARKSKIGASPESGLKRLEGRLNINMIKGGLKENIVPDECIISVDRRLIPEENLDKAEKELIDVLKSLKKKVDWEIKTVLKCPTIVTDDPIVDKLSEIVKQVTGNTGKYGFMGSGDFAQILLDWRAKSFGIGLIRPESNIHGKDEFVYLKDLEDLAEIIQRFLTS